jgi:hypothetical protein
MILVKDQVIDGRETAVTLNEGQEVGANTNEQLGIGVNETKEITKRDRRDEGG